MNHKHQSSITIDDGEVGLRRPPNRVRLIMETLDHYPDGKFLSKRGLAAKLNASLDHLSHHTADPILAPYRLKMPDHRVIWGNPEAIKKLRDQL